MKRILILMTWLALLAGCSDSDTTPPAPPAPAPEVPATPTVLSGIAAVGAALDGALVEIIDASGNLVDIPDTLTGSDGSYQVTLPDGIEISIGFDVTLYMRYALQEIFTTLLFMVNASRSIKWGKYFLAIVAFIINLYFWNAFQGNIEDIVFKLFISAVIASMDFGFAHLFDNMWKERLDHVDKEIIAQSKEQLIQQIAELEQTKSLEEQKLATIELETEVAQQALNKRIAKIDDHSCPHCGRYYESIKALNGHLGQCKERKA